MSWRVVVRPEVEQDIADAAGWYEARQAGLGAEFVEEIIHVWEPWRKTRCLTPAVIRPKTFAGATPTAFLIA